MQISKYRNELIAGAVLALAVGTVIAGSTGGVYYKADDGDSMRAAMEQIDKLEKTSVEQNILVNWKEYYPVFALLALALLLGGMILEKTVLLRVP